MRQPIKDNEAYYSHFKSITYGFVDGDLHYIRKPRGKRKSVRFSAEDFRKFDSGKPEAWLSAYLTEHAKENYNTLRWSTDFTNLSEKEFLFWYEILTDNFDYKKYGD